MSFDLKSFSVLSLVCSSLSFIIGDVNKVCRIDDIRNSIGVCKPLTDCSAVIGLLRAGVKPTTCSPVWQLQNDVKICCPSNQRISSEKCDEFMKTLTQPVKGKHALVYDGSHSEQRYDNNEIKCESFFHDFISGGEKAKLRQYPYQVALGYAEKPDWRCGGTLIDPFFIMTAAHCVRTIYGPPTVILLGDRKLSTKRDSTRLLVNVSDIIVHPKYRPPLQYNDIAIVKLQAPVTLSRAILPACLPNPFDRLDKAIGIEATGWGQTGAAGGLSDILRSAILAKFDTEECTSFFLADNLNKQRLPKGIIRSQFCAGDKYGLRDTCRGDSGGPVTVENKHYPCIRYVVGITSFGSNLCGYQQPGVYTNVLSFLDWIEDTVWGNKSKKLHTNTDFSDNERLVLNQPENTETRTAGPTSTSTQPPLTSVLTLKTTILPPFQTLNQKYNYNVFNISGTIADLLNKFSFGR